jgi:hypothetical protein
MSLADRNPEEAMRAHQLAEAEGRICLCSHLESFHWDYTRNSECGVAGCDCAEYRPDNYEGMRMRLRKHEDDTLKGVQGALTWAAQTSKERLGSNETTWEEAVTRWEEVAAQAEGPLPFPDQPRVSRKHDRAVLDALGQLGGNPEDLTG